MFKIIPLEMRALDEDTRPKIREHPLQIQYYNLLD